MITPPLTPALPPLLGGPYLAPSVQVGDRLVCAVRGEAKVVAFSAAPIPWPLGVAGKGPPTLVVCGDLDTAVRTESAGTVMDWWGCGAQAIARWRKVLGVGKTPGTTQAHRHRFARIYVRIDPVKVRAARLARGLSKVALAAATGIPRRSLGVYESGKVLCVPPVRLLALERVLRVPRGSLAREEDRSAPLDS